ncbi:hypothetical protein HZR84_04870 [Hyphobacterium sp. CCMP332]|nr:hypothetical protein HZR84_04870 [Hyphobacterium sp. CCMP332]
MKSFFLILIVSILAINLSYSQVRKQHLILANNDTIVAKVLQGKMGGKILIEHNRIQKVLEPNEYISFFYAIVDLNLEEYGDRFGGGIGFFGIGPIDAHIKAGIGNQFFFTLSGGVRTAAILEYESRNRQGPSKIKTHIAVSAFSGFTAYGKKHPNNNDKILRRGFFSRVGFSLNENFVEYIFQTGMTWEYYSDKNKNRSWSLEIFPYLAISDNPTTRYWISEVDRIQGLTLRIAYTNY